MLRAQRLLLQLLNLAFVFVLQLRLIEHKRTGGVKLSFSSQNSNHDASSMLLCWTFAQIIVTHLPGTMKKFLLKIYLIFMFCFENVLIVAVDFDQLAHCLTLGHCHSTQSRLLWANFSVFSFILVFDYIFLVLSYNLQNNFVNFMSKRNYAKKVKCGL